MDPFSSQENARWGWMGPGTLRPVTQFRYLSKPGRAVVDASQRDGNHESPAR